MLAALACNLWAVQAGYEDNCGQKPRSILFLPLDVRNALPVYIGPFLLLNLLWLFLITTPWERRTIDPALGQALDTITASLLFLQGFMSLLVSFSIGSARRRMQDHDLPALCDFASPMVNGVCSGDFKRNFTAGTTIAKFGSLSVEDDAFMYSVIGPALGVEWIMSASSLLAAFIHVVLARGVKAVKRPARGLIGGKAEREDSRFDDDEA